MAKLSLPGAASIEIAPTAADDPDRTTVQIRIPGRDGHVFVLGSAAVRAFLAAAARELPRRR